jgi:hypothetical protein
MPTTAEMFDDAQTPGERVDRIEALKGALKKTIDRHDTKRDGFVPLSEAEAMGVDAGIQRGVTSADADRSARLIAAAERYSALTKDMTGEDQAAVTAELDALNAIKDQLAKDITVSTPGNLHPYDLEAPAKILVPRFTPLRNEMPRAKGQGTAREYRRILGYSNTGMGGVANLTPFFTSESGATLSSGGATFGALNLVRGQKISYAMDVHTVGYVELSLSDIVSWKAQFSNLGFEDSRQLSQMALLWAHLLGEERAMLYGRSSGTGYEGVVAAPTPVTLASVGSASGSGFGTTAFVKVTAYTGMGESLPSAEATNAGLTANAPLGITLPSQPTGAIAYGVYASTTTGTETFQGFFVPGTSTVNQIVVPNYVTGGAVVPAADGSANANAYDGFLSVLTDPAQSGYFARADVTYQGKTIYNATAANQVGDKPWQDAFASLYASVYADPDEVWLAAAQRRSLADFLRSAANTSAAYRIALTEGDATGGANVGAAVVGLVNESSPTDRIVRLRVHPYMPTGASFIRSVTLPIPDSHIAETTVAINVQDYMSVEWEPIQFSYDASTYQLGTIVHYAPKWSGAILGLT